MQGFWFSSFMITKAADETQNHERCMNLLVKPGISLAFVGRPRLSSALTLRGTGNGRLGKLGLATDRTSISKTRVSPRRLVQSRWLKKTCQGYSRSYEKTTSRRSSPGTTSLTLSPEPPIQVRVLSPCRLQISMFALGPELWELHFTTLKLRSHG